MRIAYPVTGVVRPRSGLSVYAIELLTAMVSGAGRVQPVLCSASAGARRMELGSTSLPVAHVLSLLGRLQRRQLARLEWSTPQWDAVHFLDSQTLPTARPSVVTVHDLAPFELQERFPDVYTDAYNPALPMYRRAIQRAVQRCDVIICDSVSTRDDLAARFPASAARAVVVHPGVRLPAPGFRRAPSRDPAMLLMVGRVEHRKNIAMAAATTRLLRSRGLAVELHVAGSLSTTESATVQRECVAAGDPAAITWHGEVDSDTLQRLHESATVLLFPSLLEGFGFPPLEALVAGVPVIASDIPVHRETMGGITPLVDPQAVEAWADAVARVLDGSITCPTDATAQLRERGIGWDLCAQAVTAVYATLTERRAFAAH